MACHNLHSLKYEDVLQKVAGELCLTENELSYGVVEKSHRIITTCI